MREATFRFADGRKEIIFWNKRSMYKYTRDGQVNQMIPGNKFWGGGGKEDRNGARRDGESAGLANYSRARHSYPGFAR